MIKISKACVESSEVLALLGRLTYAESHGGFIEDKNDLVSYLDQTFSVSNTKKELLNPNNLYYVIYVDDLPVGYAKLILNATHESVISKRNCLLDKIYILKDFIPLKIGNRFLKFLEDQARQLQLDTMWLSVYVENFRAIKFYQKNEYIHIGNISFLVNGTPYDNLTLSKNLTL